MIVKMKKVFLVVLDSTRESSLEALRDCGVLHLESRAVQSDTLTELEEKRSRLVRVIQLLSGTKEKTSGGEGSGRKNLDEYFSLADRILQLSDRERDLREELNRLYRERTRLQNWGDFNPGDIGELESEGIILRLYTMNRKDFESLPEDLAVYVIKESKDLFHLVVAAAEEPCNLPGLEFPVPAMGIKELDKQIQSIEGEIGAITGEISRFSGEIDSIRQAVSELDGMIEFEEVRAGMNLDGPLAYLTGYIPEDLAGTVEKKASEEEWAVLVEDPGEDDPVPTLVRNPKWIRIIKPLFDFLGTVPGYREYDISFFFLLFFSVFYAMIIGDAGYGCLFLVLSVFARMKFRKAPPEFFFLLMVTSVCTIVWGAITGNWFGFDILVRPSSPLSGVVIGAIAAFPGGSVSEADVTKTVMHMCFVIGAIHLSIAHIKNFFKKFPKLAAFAEPGWLCVVWGMFFLIQLIVLEKGDFGVLEAWFPGPWLLIGGLGLITIFGEQDGRFLKGIGLGLANLPLKLLDSIGSFSDIISYVRLFAVGLASLEVAKAFNAMALNIGLGFPAGLAAALILFFGHALNIVMGALALIVHGVRLNVLEFSNHLGMEWTGIPYKPFRNYRSMNGQL
jgi:V/A-type H+-transporting ATPase subunit I